MKLPGILTVCLLAAISAGKIRTAADLTKVLENTTWEFTADVPGTEDVRSVILLPAGVLLCGWNNARGTWKATDRNKVQCEIPAAAT